MAADLFESFPLRPGRAHEACGAGATAFACVSAAQTGGHLIWVCEGWRAERINPAGFAAILDPARLLLALARDQTDMLAVAEEALRSGAVAAVVTELGRPIDLKAGRRLQLAAEAGGAVGVCLVPEGMGSNAAETRWRCSPVFDPADSTLHRWELIKNKSGKSGSWHVRWDAAARRLRVVSPAGERPGSAGAPG